MVQLLLEIHFIQDSKDEGLFCGAPSGLFFSNDLFGLGFKLIQDNFPYGFARMPNEADSTVVLTEL